MSSETEPQENGLVVDLAGRRMSGRLVARFGIDADTSPTVTFTGTGPVCINGVIYKWGGMTLSRRDGVFRRASGHRFLIRDRPDGSWSGKEPTHAARTTIERWAVATATRLSEEHSDQFRSARHIKSADYTSVAANLRHAARILDRFSAVAIDLEQPGATIRVPQADEPSVIAWPTIRDTAIPHSDHIQAPRPAPVVAVAQAADGEPLAYLVKIHRPHRNGGTDTPLAVPIDLAIDPEAWHAGRAHRCAPRSGT